MTGHVAEHLVTGTVPESVIYLFEPVEVDERERDPLALPRGDHQLLELAT